MKSAPLLLVAVLLCAAGRASALDAREELNVAYDSARAAAKASAAKVAKVAYPAQAAESRVVNSCGDGQEWLETSYEMTVSFANGLPSKELHFNYAGCDTEGRNDYIPPYTERYYKAADKDSAGYSLTFVTTEGEQGSDVLLSNGKTWVGRSVDISNVGLHSGDSQILGGVTLQQSWGPESGKATIRSTAQPQYAQLKACETGDWSKSGTDAPKRDSYNKPATGWDGRGGPSLVLLTKDSAYYYYESCDICADIARCELSTGKVTQFAAAHSLDCGDLKAPRSQPDIVFDACAPRKP